MYAIRHRHKIIPKIIATYAKRYLQVSDYDPEIMAQLAKYGAADKGDVKDDLHLINVEGRLNKKFKMNLSFHKRGMQGAKYYRLQQVADSKLYQMFIPSIMTQDKVIDVKDVYPDELREKVQEYLTDTKNKELAFSNLNEAKTPEQATMNEQESRMEAIMALVNSTSKSIEIYRQLINISGVLVFT